MTDSHQSALHIASPPLSTVIQDGLLPPARYCAMAVVILGIALAVLDGTIVNLALPGIARDLQITASDAVWVINAYQVAILALLLPCARLGDLIGCRRVYLGGISLFIAASFGCSMADSLPMLTVARAIQGLGAAGIMSMNAALVRLIYPMRMLGRGFAINSMVVATASVAGAPLAAAILSVASWPWLFMLNLPLGLIAFWLGLRTLPNNLSARPINKRLPWFDVLLNALMFSLVFLGVDALGTRTGASVASPRLACGTILLVGGVAVGVAYVRRQLRQAVPLFPLDLLRIPVFALSMCTSVGAFAAQMLAYIALPFLMLDSYGRTPLQAGFVIMSWPLAIIVVAPIVGRLIGRYPGGLLGGVGLGIMSIGLALLAALPAQPANADIVWRLTLCGIGFGMFQSPNNHTVVMSAPIHRSGGASGMIGTARLTGQTIGAVLLAVIFSFASAQDGRGPAIALALAACLAALGSGFSTLRLRHSSNKLKE